MLSRRTTTNRELLLLLVALILLAVLAQAARPAPIEKVTFTSADVRPTLVSAGDPTTNPYWTPTHAFPRKPISVYSDAQEASAD